MKMVFRVAALLYADRGRCVIIVTTVEEVRKMCLIWEFALTPLISIYVSNKQCTGKLA